LKKSEKVGNIASTSSSLKTIIAKTPLQIKKDYKWESNYLGQCYIKSCSNCEILYKRIPEMVDSIEAK
ncbi:unnamed protein product, partial [marine sediment metagenome]